MRGLISIFCVSVLMSPLSTCILRATTAPVSNAKELYITLIDKSFFTDRVATAQIQHSHPLILRNEAPFTDSSLKLLSVDSRETQQKNSLRYQTQLRFLPLKTGNLQFPALSWKSPIGLLQTKAIDLKVDSPQKSSAMQLKIRAHKQRVFVGEPLKITLEWTSTLEINRLQELKLYPDFFNIEGIEVVVPRISAPKDAQIGMPLGGRRIIAHRKSSSPQKLGKVHLDLFLRFQQTGHYKFTSSRLECGLIASSNRSFAPYAAHFNNAFFEPVDTKVPHKRIYVDSEAFGIHVLALPPNTSEHPFTGLFTPITFKTRTTTNATKVGELIPLQIDCTSQARHMNGWICQNHIYTTR